MIRIASCLGIVIALDVLAANTAIADPVFPAATEPFQATYLWTHKETGNPLLKNPNLSKIPSFLANIRAALLLPKDYQPQKGDCLFTIASDGHSQLYLWSVGGKPSNIYLITNNHTFSTEEKVVELEKGFPPQSVPWQLPIFPATLPGGPPFVKKRAPLNGEVDSSKPAGEVLINIEPFLAFGRQGGVYQPGVLIKQVPPGSGLTIRYGPASNPAYSVSMSGMSVVQGVNIPKDITVKTSDHAVLPGHPYIGKWNTWNTYRLVSAGPLTLPPSAFKPQSYLTQKQLESNDTIGISLEPYQSAAAQTAGTSSPEKEPGKQGLVLAILVGVIMAAIAGAVLRMRKKKGRNL